MNKPSAEEHLGLVRLCANRFRGRGIEYDDLYSAGCIGLLKATEAFDCDRGVKFSTYAVPVILGEIKRLFRDGGSVSEEDGKQIDISVPAPDTEIGDILALRQIMELLDEKDRQLIIMRYFQGLTQSVTAKNLNMTQVQVSRREKKLLTFMREQLLE